MSILEALRSDNREVGKTPGVAAGIVTNNQDPEGLARVKVKFLWLSDQNETDWIRIATLMAGADRGTFFLPQVGDEVLVAFEHGDINRSYVIGALWNGVHKPPETNSDGQNDLRKIRSRSGHELTFNEMPPREKWRSIPRAAIRLSWTIPWAERRSRLLTRAAQTAS